MSEITELADPEYNHREFLFPCDGGDDHFLRLSWDDDEDFRWLYITQESGFGRLRSRIKDAWAILMGRPVETHTVVLDEETVESLRKTLDEIAPKTSIKPVIYRYDPSGSIKPSDSYPVWTINGHAEVPGQQELPFGDEESLIGEVHND